MLNYFGATVPAVAASFLTPERLGVVCVAVIKALHMIESGPEVEPDLAKRQAYKLTLANFELNSQVLGRDPEIDQFVKQNLIPAQIDGQITAFNLSGLYGTSKPVAIGGAHNPAPASGPSRIPGPAPTLMPDSAPPGGP